MSENLSGSSEIEGHALSTSDDLNAFAEDNFSSTDSTNAPTTLASLPIGARLIVRCRADWREAVVTAIAAERITLSILAPSGRTYRIRRPPNAPLIFDGTLPILGEGAWRAMLARSDKRW